MASVEVIVVIQDCFWFFTLHWGVFLFFFFLQSCDWSIVPAKIVNNQVFVSCCIDRSGLKNYWNITFGILSYIYIRGTACEQTCRCSIYKNLTLREVSLLKLVLNIYIVTTWAKNQLWHWLLLHQKCCMILNTSVAHPTATWCVPSEVQINLDSQRNCCLCNSYWYKLSYWHNYSQYI